MKLTISSYVIVASLLLATACVHEYPESGQEVDPTAIDLTIELSTDPSVTTSSVLSKDGADAPDAVLFVVELYKDEFEGEPVLRHEETAVKDADGKAAISIPVLVHAGNYRLAAFASSVSSSDPATCLYDMTDLGNVTFSGGTYVGSTDFKECYDLRMDINLSSDEWNSEQTVSGVLSSPTGRVEVISEDAGDFLSRIHPQLSPDNSAENEDFWQNYYVRWSYALYFPTGYSVFTGYPNNTGTGIGFESDIQPLSDEEVLMGYDYVFVNGESTSVDITLEVYDRNTGEAVNTFSGLKADILKGQTTVIRGDFLTVDKGSGVGIDTEFDGDIDIFLPD